MIKMHQVLIEWDGEQPPTSWYNRLHALAGKVRGDKQQSPIVRREERGLIFQEGAILCQSESLARLLATYAKEEFGARSVAIGTVEIEREFIPSREDWALLSKMQSILGRRGPKPKEEQFVVTCLEEMQVSEMIAAVPVQCPHCHSPRIHARKGKAVEYIDDDRPIMELWRATRFAGSHWEPATVSVFGDVQAPAASNVILAKTEDEILLTMMSVSDLPAQLTQQIKRREALEVLDAIYVGRRFMEQSRRQRARVEAAARYFEAGGSAVGVSLHERPIPDMLDAACMLGSQIGVVYAQVTTQKGGQQR